MKIATRIAVGLLCLAVTAAGCGGGSSSGGTAHHSVLRVGTTFYIDTLNPFVGIETQDSTAYGMVFPQLVQYGPGLHLDGDWAKSWKYSDRRAHADLPSVPGGKWSDGVPLTAQDAVWTIQTTLKYASGPTSYLAGVLSGVDGATAPNANTLVVHYSPPGGGGPGRSSSRCSCCPSTSGKYTGNHGKDLLTFHPEQHLPMVSGGAYTVTKFQEKGTTVFTPNKYFYGPKSNAAAVTLSYYTNPTSMIADLEQGNLDFVDAIPYTAASKLTDLHNIKLTFQPGDEVTNLGFNSNPLKTKNRELLNPTLKKAFEYAIPRQQIVDVVFGGHAQPGRT